MERTKKTSTATTVIKPTWKKVGGGSLRIGNRIIKPDQIFEAFPEEISPAFRNMVIPVSGNASFVEAEAQEALPTEVVKPSYEIKPRGTNNMWFDVVDGNGKVINEKALKKEVAEKLVEDLLK